MELLKKVSERCPVEGAEGAKEGIEVVGRGKEEDIVLMRECKMSEKLEDRLQGSIRKVQVKCA